MATTVDDNQAQEVSVEPGAELPRRRSTGAGEIRYVRVNKKRQRRRREGLILAVCGLVLIAVGATILLVKGWSSSGSNAITATQPVAMVVSGSSTVLVGKAKPGTNVNIVAFNLPLFVVADKTGTWRLNVPLSHGVNRFVATYVDVTGHKRSTTYTVTVPPATTVPRATTTASATTPATTIPATSPPTTIGSLALTVTSPRAGTVITGNRVFVIGSATPGTTIVGAGLKTTADPSGSWSLSITLLPGANHLQFTATAPNATPNTIDLLVISVTPTTAPTTTPTTIQPTTTACCPPDTGP